MDGERNFFGVMLDSSTPAAVEVYPGVNGTTESKPLVVFRSMGGHLRLNVFTGPTPREVARQLSDHVGRARVPPRWALGYHVCRKTGSYLGMEAALRNMNVSAIPYDTDCIDERFMR